MSTHRFSASYASAPASVPALRGELAAIGRECAMSDAQLHDLRLAVSEAATNAVLHGPQDEGTRISVEVHLDAGRLVVKIRDSGNGIRPRTDSPGAGLGLSVIGAVTEEFDIARRGNGTEVWMTFPCPAGAT